MKDWEEDLIKYSLGFQFNNPLKTVWINTIPDHLGESELRKKYKNYELPDGFTEEELKELDLFVKEREL